MATWLQEFRRPVILDGAVGTELVARGLRLPADCPERWTLERANEVREVHAAYISAGVDVIQTNTFGATRPRLARFRLESRQQEVIASAVSLAREVAGSARVVGALGPTGLTLPLGRDADLGEVTRAFAEAASCLERAGVDAIHLETMFHAGELAAALKGARAGAPKTPLWASVTLMPGASGLETPHGVPMSRMIAALEETLPEAVGVNCTLDAERMLRPLSELVAVFADRLPIIAKPQARRSEKCASGTSLETPERFADHAAGLVRAGATAVGGCCGVGPRELRALVSRLRPRSEEARLERAPNQWGEGGVST